MEYTKVKNRLKKISAVNKRDILNIIISFLLGRTFIMGTISPFSIAYLCTCIYAEKFSPLKVSLAAMAAITGILTTEYSNTFIRYMLAYVLFALIYIASSTIIKKKNHYLPVICAVIATALSGIIYYAQLKRLYFNIMMLTFECFICFVLPFLIKNAWNIVCNKKLYEETTSEDIVTICIITTISMGGFCGMHIGSISLAKVMCGVFIMIFAYTEKCALSVTCGVGLGILFSLYSFEYNEYAGILGFCGLITGIASQFKRPGIILSFIISTRLLVAYFGGWSDSVFSGFETILSICIFTLIPNSLLLRIKSFFSYNLLQSKEFKKYREIITHKTRKTLNSLNTLADLSRQTICKYPENFNDLSSLYHITANKVCRSCGLKFICWNKEAFDTADSLNKAVAVLNNTGCLTSETVPAEFKRRCVRYENFINELNRTYLKHKSQYQWQTKVEQSQKMLSVQLNGVTDMMESFSNDINKAVTFNKLDESRIMYNMEKSEIKCYDITVVKNHEDILCVNLVIKKGKDDFTKLCEKAETIVSATLNKLMKLESYTCNKNKYTLKLKEMEHITITTGHVSLPKKGENVCGDNFVYGKITGNKYMAILSDGMGCGESAAIQSETATELMHQFTNAGFNKNNAIDMINSALMLKNPESFATIDAVILDLFSAKAEFIKAGANTTYIKSGNSLKKISSSSLPVGIINNTKAESFEYKVKSGDIIIMISDGVHNATDQWFEEYILNMHETDPDLIARLLTDEAKRKTRQADDMTTIVLKIDKTKEDIYV